MPWILHDAYLLGDVGTVILRETSNGELHTLPSEFRRPGETDAQLDARMQAKVAAEIESFNVYLSRRISTRARWQPRNEPGK